MSGAAKELIESNPARVEWLRMKVRVHHADEVRIYGLASVVEDLHGRGILSGDERDWILEDAAAAKKEA